MKKTVCLVMALVFIVAVFAGCAKKAEAQTLDVLKVKSATAVAANKELDKEAVVEAFNAATTGNILSDNDKEYQSHDLILIVTTDGTMPIFENGENKFVVFSSKLGYAYTIESAELYKLYKAE